MNNVLRFWALIFLVFLCSCEPRFDEQSAIKIVREKLGQTGQITVKKLTGGVSGNLNFLVSNDKKYVVRCLMNHDDARAKLEINNFKIASDAGYGPRVYYADVKQRVMVMEYLDCKMLSVRDIENQDEFCMRLARLLHKIHNGPAFGRTYDMFFELERRMRTARAQHGDLLPFAQIENMVGRVRDVLLPHMKKVACHNDMHSGNVLLCGNELKAIDFDNAGQGDPYFDMAKFEFELDLNPLYKGQLLSVYLGRAPSQAEKAKLYLTKLIIDIWKSFSVFRRLSPELARTYRTLEVPKYDELKRAYMAGEFDHDKPENRMMLSKVLMSDVCKRFESQEFQEAVNTLTRR